MQETQQMWVQSLSGEDPLEKEIATHSSTLAWRILWTEEPLGYCPRGRKESDTTYRLNNKTEQEWKQVKVFLHTQGLKKKFLFPTDFVLSAGVWWVSGKEKNKKEEKEA